MGCQADGFLTVAMPWYSILRLPLVALPLLLLLNVARSLVVWPRDGRGAELMKPDIMKDWISITPHWIFRAMEYPTIGSVFVSLDVLAPVALPAFGGYVQDMPIVMT